MIDKKPKVVGILMFNDVEVLDFAGPFEVFSLAENEQGEKLFKVVTIAQTSAIIFAKNGLKVLPDYTLASHPKLDVLVIPGGDGADLIAIHNDEIISWIKATANQVIWTLSVCTGAFLLAKAGLLKGKQATTHWMDIERLATEFSEVDVLSGVHYVDASDDEFNIVTSAGISAGIQASLYSVAKLTNKNIVNQTAKRMQFDYQID